MSVIYRGPSLLDGKPIVVIATVTDTNSKTGAMVQTYIIRSDIAPTEANKLLCGGNGVRAKSIAIPVHGAGAGNFAA